MPAEKWKFETDCFQILPPDILQLCNVMLLVDWLQENDFYSLNTQKNGIFSRLHDYISVRLWNYSDYIEWLKQQILALSPLLTMLMGEILKK